MQRVLFREAPGFVAKHFDRRLSWKRFSVRMKYGREKLWVIVGFG